MYAIRYTREIIASVNTVCTILDIDMYEYFSPIIYYIVVFCLNIISFPLYLLFIIKFNRDELININTKIILLKNFNIEKQ